MLTKVKRPGLYWRHPKLVITTLDFTHRSLLIALYYTLKDHTSQLTIVQTIDRDNNSRSRKDKYQLVGTVPPKIGTVGNYVVSNFYTGA